MINISNNIEISLKIIQNIQYFTFLFYIFSNFEIIVI